MAKRRAVKDGRGTSKKRKFLDAVKKYAATASGAALGFIGADIPGAIAGGRAGYAIGSRKAQPVKGKGKRKYVRKLHRNGGFKGPFKPRVINAWPKGLSRKFVKKVNMALETNDVWGKYIYTANAHVYQANIDSWGEQYGDENGFLLTSFSPEQFQDAAAVMWNGKAPTKDYRTTSGNFSVQEKLHISSSMVEYQLVSTCQHCVTLEMYEFRAKSSQDVQPLTLIAQSYANLDYVNQYRNYTGASTMNSQVVGSVASDWVEVYKYFHVKKRTICLQPGCATKVKLWGPSNITYDLSKDVNNGVTNQFSKILKTVNVYFRVINDITVSAGSGAIHNFQSPSTGGVAIRYKRTFLMRPPLNALSSNSKNNTIWDNFWYLNPAGASDQVVEENNPATVITGGL